MPVEHCLCQPRFSHLLVLKVKVYPMVHRFQKCATHLTHFNAHAHAHTHTHTHTQAHTHTITHTNTHARARTKVLFWVSDNFQELNLLIWNSIFQENFLITVSTSNKLVLPLQEHKLALTTMVFQAYLKLRNVKIFSK